MSSVVLSAKLVACLNSTSEALLERVGEDCEPFNPTSGTEFHWDVCFIGAAAGGDSPQTEPQH